MQKCSCTVTKDAGPFVSKYYHGWCRNIHLKITVHPCVQLRGEISKKLKCVPKEGLPVQYLRWRFETKGILKRPAKKFSPPPKILVIVNSSPPCGSNLYQIFWIHDKLNLFVKICTLLYIDFIQSLKLMTYLFTHPSSIFTKISEIAVIAILFQTNLPFHQSPASYSFDHIPAEEQMVMLSRKKDKDLKYLKPLQTVFGSFHMIKVYLILRIK